ncbi:hypothetical protein D4R42_00900 [bacterium]|nr:MAG: hypothetical protein D4R42_00900 [bacterium]
MKFIVKTLNRKENDNGKRKKTLHKYTSGYTIFSAINSKEVDELRKQILIAMDEHASEVTADKDSRIEKLEELVKLYKEYLSISINRFNPDSIRKIKELIDQIAELEKQLK